LRTKLRFGAGLAHGERPEAGSRQILPPCGPRHAVSQVLGRTYPDAALRNTTSFAHARRDAASNIGPAADKPKVWWPLGPSA